MLIPDFMNPVYPAIVKGAESAAGELGAGLLVASSCDGGFGGLRKARVDAAGGPITAEYTEEAGARAMERILAAEDRPTAIFAANMFQAVGALRATRLAGVTVPRDLSIVAIHDLRPAAFVDPALTTVRMPLEELGRRAVQLLDQSSPDEHFQEVVAEPMELVVRDSTAPPPS